MPLPTVKSKFILKYAAARYTVSADGVLRGTSGQLLVPPVNVRGYPILSIRRRQLSITQKVLVHRVVAYQKFDDVMFEPGIVVRHLDGNKFNYAPDNISIGTGQSNTDDNVGPIMDRMIAAAKAAGRSRRRFDARTVQKIRKLHSSGFAGYKCLARQFRCAPSTICSIVKGQFYQDL